MTGTPQTQETDWPRGQVRDFAGLYDYDCLPQWHRRKQTGELRRAAAYLEDVSTRTRDGVVWVRVRGKPAAAAAAGGR